MGLANPDGCCREAVGHREGRRRDGPRTRLNPDATTTHVGPDALVRAGERSSPGFLLLVPGQPGAARPGRWDTCPYLVRDGRTPLLRSLRIELLARDFLGRGDLLIRLLLARLLPAQSLKFRKCFFLLSSWPSIPCTCETRYHATSLPAFSATASADEAAPARASAAT